LLGGVVLLAAWWVLFSRAPWLERVAPIVFMPMAVIATRPLVHVSIQTGNMGMMLGIYSIPVLSTALVAWAWWRRRGTGSSAARLGSMAAMLLASCLGFTLLRTEGVTSEGADLHWRWTPSYEERFLATTVASPPPEPTPATVQTPQAAPVRTA